MDAVIVGILIVIVTGVLIALVRKSADKPRPPKFVHSRVDVVDLDIVGSNLHPTIPDFAGDDSLDAADTGH